MTRRAAILAVAAAIPAIGQKEDSTAYSLDLQFGPKPTGACTPIPIGDGRAVYCEREFASEPAYVLTVRYGSRVAHITASELMDALEGK